MECLLHNIFKYVILFQSCQKALLWSNGLPKPSSLASTCNTFFPVTTMGLEARKPVFGGLGTTKAQTSLRIRAV